MPRLALNVGGGNPDGWFWAGHRLVKQALILVFESSFRAPASQGLAQPPSVRLQPEGN